MDKEFFDLRNLEFRQHVMDNLFLLEIGEGERNLLLCILEKERMGEDDILRVYFILNNVNPIYLNELLFDYKVERISEERVSKFKGIVMSDTSIRFNGFTTREITTYNYLNLMLSSSKFEKLVDRFLDEV